MRVTLTAGECVFKKEMAGQEGTCGASNKRTAEAAAGKERVVTSSDVE